ncbi:ribonucleotide-diphosphate reductase subunit alpha [Mycobacterium tuberculosis]|nr:ribonucleotide-diphosphate reductase subunit alpha [Mycobacterium tuberculosis]
MIDPFKVIDLIAEIQEHVDQGISTILHVNSNISTRELVRYYIYAAKKGLKSLYYTRTKHLTVEECISCAV